VTQADDIADLVVLPDGRIVVSGWILSSSSYANVYGMARLSAEGVLDTSFGPSGSNGMVELDMKGAWWSEYSPVPQDLLVDRDGKLLLVGSGYFEQDGLGLAI